MTQHNEPHDVTNDLPPQDSGSLSGTPLLLSQAREAYEQEAFILAIHLYLAAFEYAVEHEGAQSPDASMALHFAWEISCSMRERSLAEYTYEKLEPYLSDEELASYTLRLQDLALDKLSELGISRDDLEEITGMISDELGEMGHIGKVTPIVKSVHVSPNTGLNPSQLLEQLQNSDGSMDSLPEGVSVVGFGVSPAPLAQQASGMQHIQEAPNAQGAKSIQGAQNASGAVDTVPLKASTNESVVTAQDEHAPHRDEHDPQSVRAFVEKSVKSATQAPHPNPSKSAADRVTYADIVGFDDVIEDVRSYGLGVEQDPELYELSRTLQKRHGLEKITSFGSMVFRTTSRDDASFFMAATVGELGLPAMRVQVQPGPQGMPVLAVSVSADKASRINPNRPQLDVPSVLVLEDIDIWGPALLTNAAALENDPHAQGPLAQAGRGVREALTVIHAAVSNPDVCVLASMGAESEDQGFLYELLDPMNIVDIYLPTEIERSQVWQRIALEHPSIASLDLQALSRMSRNMCRMDIVAAARETLEDVYRTSLKNRTEVELTQEMLYSHLANYQPLDSAEYKELEDAVAHVFGQDLEVEMYDLLSDGNDYGY